MYYAQINQERIAYAVTETAGQITAPDMVALESFDTSVIGKQYTEQGVWEEVTTPPVVLPRKITKRAFQDRFPMTPNGVSRKYDLMALFMSDDGYAASLGVTGAQLYDLRAMIVTGLNRLNASQFVDLDLPDASNFTMLMLATMIPEAFRLTTQERTAILEAPVQEGERWNG